MNPILRVVDWLWEKGATSAQPEERMRGRVVAGIALLFFVMELVFIVGAFVSGGLDALGPVALAVFTFNLVLLRTTGSVKLVGGVLCTEVLLGWLAAAGLRGGHEAFIQPGVPFLVLLACLMVNVRMGAVAAGVMTLGSVAYYAAERAALFVPKNLADFRINVMVTCIELVSVLMVVRLYASVHAAARQELRENERKLEVANGKLWAELGLAKKIQTALLPVAPKVEGYDVAAFMSAAEDVGGDYYDVIPQQDGHWVAIGDVSGHGVTSGLVVMMAKTAVGALLEARGERILTPARVLEQLNASMLENLQKIDRDKYMTLTLLRFEPGNRVVYAGMHQDLLVYRAKSKSVERIATRGTWVGLGPRITLDDDELTLAAGDTLLLFTDGVTEAVRDNDLFGLERLEQTFGALCQSAKSSEQIVQGLREDLAAFAVRDDVTLMAISRPAIAV